MNTRPSSDPPDGPAVQALVHAHRTVTLEHALGDRLRQDQNHEALEALRALDVAVPDPPIDGEVAALVRAHGAATLAAAFVERLRVDGHGSATVTAVATIAAGLARIAGNVGPVDPDPH